MTNDHHCSKLVKIDRFRKGVGSMPSRMLLSIPGYSIWIRKNSPDSKYNILGVRRVMRPWILQDIIVYSTCTYPYSGKVGREYVPFCPVVEGMHTKILARDGIERDRTNTCGQLNVSKRSREWSSRSTQSSINMSKIQDC